MTERRKNLCKVPSDLRDRLNRLRDGDSWPEFMAEVARVFEQGVVVQTERLGNQPSQTRLDPGDTHEVVGDQLAVTVSFARETYDCSECGDTHPLSEVLVLDDGDRVVCSRCVTAEDRVL